MRKIKVLTCGRCGDVPKATSEADKWFKIFCPACHIGRSKHSCNDLDFVVKEWNTRAKHYRKELNKCFSGFVYTNKEIEIEVHDRKTQ